MDALDDIRRQVREAQEDFTRAVDGIVGEMQAFTASVTPAIGEISYGEALDALRKVTIAAIDRRGGRR